MQVLFPALDGALSIGMLVWAFRSLWRKRTIENVPTSKAAGVFLGLTEVKGRAEREPALRSALADVACVWYDWKIEEEWERWETETTTDSNGNTQTRNVRRSGWTTIASGGERPCFYLLDETGALRVDPTGAEVEAERVLARTCSGGDPLYYGRGPRHAIADSTGRRSFREDAIRTGADLYVIGTARLRADAVAAEIAHDPEGEMFVISVRGEEAVRREYARGAAAKLFLGALAAGAVPFLGYALPLGDAGRALRETWPLMAAALAGFLVLFLAGYLRLLYNGLVSVRNRVKNAWSQIDIQLKRRFDLVPELVSCVKGYAAHEADVHARLAEIRAVGSSRGGRAMPTVNEAVAAAAFANSQTSALKSVLGVAEGYPALKADASFGRLMDELSKTEQRIALARGFYNESVTAYNNRIDTFPDVVMARIAAMQACAFFEIEAFERRSMDVKIAG